MDSLHIDKPEPKTSTDLMTLSTDQLKWLRLHPTQLQQLGELGVLLGQSQQPVKQSSPSTPSTAKVDVPNPISAPATLPIIASGGVFTPQPPTIARPAPASLPWGFQTAPSHPPSTAAQHSSSPGQTTLAGIEQLVRQHVVQNQQTLQQYAHCTTAPDVFLHRSDNARYPPESKNSGSSI